MASLKKQHLILLVFIVVLVSGCAQAGTFLDAQTKFQKLKTTTGYLIDYNIDFKFDMSEKTKAALPAAGGLATLPKINLITHFAQKGDKTKSILDLSGLAAISNGSIPFSAIHSYTKGDEASFCVLLSKGLACAKKVDIESNQQLKSLTLSLQDSYSQDPEKTLKMFKTLNDKKAITLGSAEEKIIVGRKCDKISYTISDLTKLSAEEISSLLGPGGSQPVPKEQLEQSTPILQQMLKSYQQSLCLDKEHGAVLAEESSVTVDMGPLLKGFASVFSGSQGNTQRIPDEIVFTVKTNAQATSFTSSIGDDEFEVPLNAQKLNLAEFVSLFPKGGGAVEPKVPEEYVHNKDKYGKYEIDYPSGWTVDDDYGGDFTDEKFFGKFDITITYDQMPFDERNTEMKSNYDILSEADGYTTDGKKAKIYTVKEKTEKDLEETYGKGARQIIRLKKIAVVESQDITLVLTAVNKKEDSNFPVLEKIFDRMFESLKIISTELSPTPSPTITPSLSPSNSPSPSSTLNITPSLSPSPSISPNSNTSGLGFYKNYTSPVDGYIKYTIEYQKYWNITEGFGGTSFLENSSTTYNGVNVYIDSRNFTEVKTGIAAAFAAQNITILSIENKTISGRPASIYTIAKRWVDSGKSLNSKFAFIDLVDERTLQLTMIAETSMLSIISTAFDSMLASLKVEYKSVY